MCLRSTEPPLLPNPCWQLVFVCPCCFASSTSSITETKAQAKTNLIAATMLHAAAGRGYAASVNNTSLKATCSITESSLLRSADANLGNMCMNIYNAVQPFIGSMAAWMCSISCILTTCIHKYKYYFL